MVSHRHTLRPFTLIHLLTFLTHPGTADSTVSSIFVFDIPQDYAGKTCSLKFLFPTQSQLETSAYEFSGPGTFDVEFLGGQVTKQTTYANAPEAVYDFGAFKFTPGSAVDIGECPHGCPAGQQVAFRLNAGDDTSLNYFQDFNPCRKSTAFTLLGSF